MSRPIRIGLVFFLASVAWIFLSDLAVFTLFDDADTQRLAQTFKGWLYVALATLLVVYLARRELRAVEAERRELEISERRFRQAVEQAPFPAMLHAEDGTVLTVSDVWTELTGYPHEEILTIADWTERAFGDRAGAVQDVMQSLYGRNGRTTQGEQRVRTRAGTERIWDFSSVTLPPLPDGRGLVLTMASDVTERVQKEEALRASEVRYRNLFDRAPVPMWIYDLDTLAFLEVNRVAVEHYGWSREAFLELTVAEIRPESEVEKLKTVAGSEPGLNRAGVWTHRTRDGTRIQVEITSYPIEFRGRNARFVMAVDVTSREEVHEALRRSRETYEQLFRNTHAVMLVIDPEDGSIVDANPAAAQFYGYTPEQLRTMNIAEINRSDPRVLEQRMADVRERRARYFRFQHRLADGSSRDVEVFSGPVQIGGQSVLFSIVHDVSDRAEARRQLEHAQRMELIGRLAGTVAHDFNNMLAVIRNTADLALEGAEDDSLRSDLLDIRRASDRGAKLTRQLLSFSRKQVSQPEVLDVARTLGEMANGLRRLTGEHIHLDLELTDRPTPVYLDPAQLEQVVLNLVVNARDAVVDRGVVRIRTTVEPDGDTDWVHLVVEDDGPGVAPELEEQIFEPFFTTKVVGKGTGLGLSTVAGILQEAGGGLMLDSSYRDGARFVARLPKLAEEAADAADTADSNVAGTAGPAAEPEPAPAETVRPEVPIPTAPILLVEDDDSLRQVMDRILTRAGYRVIPAASGKQAVEIVTAGDDAASPALIVSDVVMPGLTGPDMLAELRRRGCAAPVLFASGYSPENASELVSEFPGSLFMEKPFTPVQLLDRVREALYSASG